VRLAGAPRLPPRFAVSQLPTTQRHSPSGVNRPLRGRFNITRHSAKLGHSLRSRFARWPGPALRRALSGSQNAALCLAPLRDCQASMCALRRMASVRVTARAPVVACGRALPSNGWGPHNRNFNHNFTRHPGGRCAATPQLAGPIYMRYTLVRASHKALRRFQWKWTAGTVSGRSQGCGRLHRIARQVL